MVLRAVVWGRFSHMNTILYSAWSVNKEHEDNTHSGLCDVTYHCRLHDVQYFCMVVKLHFFRKKKQQQLNITYNPCISQASYILFFCLTFFFIKLNIKHFLYSDRLFCNVMYPLKRKKMQPQCSLRTTTSLDYLKFIFK